MIDVALQGIVDAMATSGFSLPDPLTAEGLRSLLDNPLPGPVIEVALVRDVTFDSPAGSIGTRLYHPQPGQSLPLALLLHGGGWVVGSLDSHDGMARAIVREAGCAVLAIDYRRAPEFPYPAALDDCISVIERLPAKAAPLGIDASRYAVVGDSAGGNLAAAIALRLRHMPNAPRAQVLFYPVTDMNFETRSYLEADSGGMLTREMMMFFWKAYIGDAEPDGLAAPLRASDLSSVAPATLILAANDPLHDEGVAFARRLQEAGVPTDLHDFSGAIHGFASFHGAARIADQAIAIAGLALDRSFD